MNTKQSVAALIFGVGMMVFGYVTRDDQSSETETTSAAAPAKPSLPDWADNAETGLYVKVNSVFDAFMNCKELTSKVENEYLIGCAPTEGEALPFLLFAADEPQGDNLYNITAINGKAKQYAHMGEMQELAIDSSDYRNDIDISAAMTEYASLK